MAYANKIIAVISMILLLFVFLIFCNYTKNSEIISSTILIIATQAISTGLIILRINEKENGK